MFDSAKENITNWTKVSKVNKGFTKGVSWNILAKDFDINHNYHILSKINMIREFGKFLPNNIKPEKTVRKRIEPIHKDPEFNTL